MKERLFFPATERNRDPILKTLRPLIQPDTTVLEIASGSGEHLAHFAEHFPSCAFFPTDIEPECLDSIDAWMAFKGHSNVRDAQYLNCLDHPHDLPRLDGLLCINMIHISPPESLGGVLRLAGDHLKSGGFLYFYGPFKINGAHTAPSNVSFEEWLKSKDPRFGVRDIQEVVDSAADQGLELESQLDMPANNFSLVFRKN